MDNKIKIFALGGSLRQGSFSRIILDTLPELGSENAEIETFNDFAAIPAFNQDLEQQLPESVLTLKNKLKAADAIIFVTPEYNYSLPGYFKNAIDWASRPFTDNSFNDKPAAIISSSTGMLGGARAQYSLRQTGVMLNIHFLNRPEVIIPAIQEKIVESKLTDAHTREKIAELIKALTDWTQRLL